MRFRLIIFVAIAALFLGCASTGEKARDIQAKGAWITDGAVAIGALSIVAMPSASEGFVARYREDTAWLSPGTKTHAIEVYLQGTNSVSQASAVVKAITQAFIEVAPPRDSAALAPCDGAAISP